MRGIDCSHWQGNINWGKVPLEYTFVFAKCSQGTAYKDITYEKNRDGIRKSGRLFGAYHYATLADPIKEADWFCKCIGDLQDGELAALDSESGQTPDWCLKFLNQCTKILGFRPLIYINSANAKSQDWSKVISANYGLWIANYGKLNVPVVGIIPPATGGWDYYAIWQYSSRATIPGIQGYCDVDYTKMDMDTLKKYGKQVICNHQCPLHCKPL